ncbi:MAG: M1 family metallopeptidase [Anaeromyxobacteraceae bacterium]
MAFTGEVDRVRSRGLYAVAEGDWYAYTFFEPVDARRAFPCFDEPWAKIPWRLTLRVPKGNRAFANAPVEAEEDLGKETRVTFARSRPLPTYLVAFVVGPFDVVDGGAGGAAKVPVRFLVPKGRGPETAYAASVTGRMIDLLEQATGVAYPYEKCDVAVVPRFWGTMEHPGIVALGQPLTLIKKEDDSRQRRERYAQIAIHELAHHWFGDLVTMAWWDDTWLNESFGSWIEAPVTEALEPSWRHLLEARIGGRAQALAADGLPSAKAIRQPVASAHDIEGSFDNAITYAKGSTVLAMFEAYVGPDRFRAAVKRHLEAKAHGVATTDDLVAAFGQELGADVAGALRGFVEQPGAPLLAVEKACGPDGARAVVTQTRFLAAGGTSPGGWSVPVCVKLGAKGREPAIACGLAGAPRAELALPYCPEWIYPNARGTGYWVSALPAKGLDALAARLDQHEQLTLANDAWLLADRGDLPVEAALSLGLALAASPDRMGVQAALGLLSLVNHDALSPRDRARHEKLLARTFGPRARALGWLPREGDDAEVNALRRQLLQAAARGGKDPVLVKEARRLADAWLGDRGAVPPEVSQAALGVAARFGDRALLERIIEEAARAEDRTERTQLLAALGEFRDPALAREALSLVVPPGTAGADAGPQFDLRETLPILRAQLTHAETQPIAWKALVSRWDAIAASTRSDDGIGLAVSAAAGACVPARRAEIAGFLTPRAEHFEGAPRALARALEAADLCAATRARNAKGVSAFLARSVGK